MMDKAGKKKDKQLAKAKNSVQNQAESSDYFQYIYDC